jgi:hypothetical protein
MKACSLDNPSLHLCLGRSQLYGAYLYAMHRSSDDFDSLSTVLECIGVYSLAIQHGIDKLTLSGSCGIQNCEIVLSMT